MTHVQQHSHQASVSFNCLTIPQESLAGLVCADGFGIEEMNVSLTQLHWGDWFHILYLGSFFQDCHSSSNFKLACVCSWFIRHWKEWVCFGVTWMSITIQKRFSDSHELDKSAVAFISTCPVHWDLWLSRWFAPQHCQPQVIWPRGWRQIGSAGRSWDGSRRSYESLPFLCLSKRK